uniref:Protease inibitor G11C4 n=1 Tax=Mayetiola destructor TaxID=39758 RepID=Q0QVT7_MAYDE|nr:protease inibitor G11C4 [Mayetiola destructor]
MNSLIGLIKIVFFIGIVVISVHPALAENNSECVSSTPKDCGPNKVLNPRFLHRCFYPQCITSTESCPDQRQIKFKLSPRPECACSDGFAYKSIDTCAPINSPECGQLGYSWPPLPYTS